ncbi:MAG: TonB-dependent receptor [Psychrosphaera sp.]|nr:TonB-dependent receptor [Psychrosphaera sp.]
MNSKLSLLTLSILAAISPAHADDAADKEAAIEVITISGDFKQQNLQQTPASVAVISADVMRQRNAQHLEDVLNTTVNVNFASGASRARFFQVRGIGERSEFVDAVNPSVGVTIDGIDYSGIGTAATLFDIDQVEIFRGPQGTRFGASAMAGMINLKGAPADGDQSGKVQLSYGNYNSRQAAVAHGMAITDNLNYRMAVQKLSSDGYIRNRHLNRDDTNNIEEFGARLNLAWTATEYLKVDIATHFFDADNGYDAFSLDNTRETLSDQPGFDTQRTKALSITGHYTAFVSADLSLQTSVNSSDLAYGYDEDWTHTNFHDWEYSSFDHYFRDHNSRTVDLRATAKPGSDANWVAGFYRQDKKVALQRLSVYGFTPLFDSTLDTTNVAVYGQRDWQVDDQVTITAGLRAEQRTSDYLDSVDTVDYITDTMWGGKFAARYQVNDQTMIYTTLSRGYKAGGVNGEAIGKAIVNGEDATTAFLAKRKSFSPEVLHNIEFGVKGTNDEGNFVVRFSAFYSHRDDVQLKGYVTESGADGNTPTFTGYIENGASGSNYGVETELTYDVNPSLQLFANFGWLQTEVKDFIAQDGTDKSGRDQAHAPEYQYNVGAVYTFDEQWFVRINADGKDAFYYSMSHDSKSENFNLINMAVGYQGEDWDITLWGRNVFDEDYGVRGFFFGNDPRDGYEAKTYTQLGEPARFGATFSYNF